MTPKQKLMWEKMNSTPNIRMLIDRLQLEPVTFDADRFSMKVQARVDTLIQEFEKVRNLPVARRTTIFEGDPSSIYGPFTSDRNIENHLISLYGQRPWPTPLHRAPF